MTNTAFDVLRSKKGIAEALGLVAIGATIVLAAGSLVANYAVLSKQASYMSLAEQAITNRAELYVSELNADLLNPRTPSLDRSCSSLTAICTQILSVTPAPGGEKSVLRIQSDAAAAFGDTITKDVTLVSSNVTHVTDIDPEGNNVWALTDEGLRYRAWGLASGKPKAVSDEDLAKPTTGTTWMQVDDRAGIDSTGALWVWGANDIGQAGTGVVTATPIKPTKVSPAGVSFRSVVTAENRSYAIDSTGTGWAWGKNDKGQLGLGHTNVVTKPTKIPTLRAMSFTIGKDNVIALTMGGDVRVAGAAQAGYSDAAGSSFRALDASAEYTAASASATTGRLALIRADGVLVVNGSTSVSPSSVKFTTVSSGADASYAISTDGSLYSWGTGTSGQLGLGATTSATVATKIPMSTKFSSVQGGSTSALAIDVTGTLHYMGKTPAGHVGKNLPQVNTPTKLLPELRFRQIAGNSADTSAALLDTAGQLYGMGTTTKGLWPMNYLAAGDQPIRMPVPDGFSSKTWK